MLLLGVVAAETAKAGACLNCCWARCRSEKRGVCSFACALKSSSFGAVIFVVAVVVVRFEFVGCCCVEFFEEAC